MTDCIEHVDNFRKSEQNDAAEQAGEESSETERPGDFILYVERAAEKEDRQNDGGPAKPVQHDTQAHGVSRGQIARVLIRWLLHVSHCLAKSADRLARISSTASPIARVAVATLSSPTGLFTV